MKNELVCYCEFGDGMTEENPWGTGKIHNLNYVGDGKFKCPKCGYTVNHSDVIFKMRFEFKKEGTNTHVYVHRPIDHRLLKKDEENSPCHCHNRKPHYHTLLDTFKDDLDYGCGLYPYEAIKKHALGLFDCEVYYEWDGSETDCGTEWDCDLFIVKETPVTSLDNNKTDGGK